MGRTVKNRKVREPAPVKKIELSDENVKKRLIAAVLFLIIGVSLLVYCFVNFLSPGNGWTTINANRTVSNSPDFVFQYYLGAGSLSASAENKALTALYNEYTEKAYQLFDHQIAFENVNNLYTLNSKPNEEITVDAALYDMFTAFQEHDSRYLYMAPICDRYDNVFFCDGDEALKDFDPLSSEEIKQEYSRTAAYVNDPDMIDVKLLGDNKVMLFVSEEYLKYAEEEGITEFIGLSWLQNAFEADYLADCMISRGYTLGSISSFDGFIRNMDSTSGTDYSFNIFDRDGDNVYQAGLMQYKNNISIVYLRNYMMNSLDFQHYYQLRSGEIRHPYLDTADGIPKASLNNLVLYSKDSSCGDILLESIPVYISEKFEQDDLLRLKEKGIYSVYCQNHTIMYNDPELIIGELYNMDGVEYKTQLF